MDPAIKIQVLARLSYSLSLKSGLSWFIMAYDLREASMVLRKSARRSGKKEFDQSFMLLGFAFENLFKSYFISTNTIGRRLPNSIGHHELLNLRNRVISWEATESEEDLLKKLTTAVYWQGRYPIALQAIHNVRVAFDSADFKALDALWHKYTRTLPAEIKAEYTAMARALEHKKRRQGL